MEALKEESDELAFGSSLESLQKMLDSQKELFHSQIDQLQNVVVTQCNLTGVNPLAQEMAAGALSIKIGKRPRDLLNPKAVKYMQAVFAIKDAISKKESREISALFGVTLAQVRDFFASQRTRVRKQVRLSQAIKSTATKERTDGINPVSDLVISLEPVPLNSVGPITSEGDPSCSKQDASLVGLAEAEKHFVENIFSAMQREETFSGQVKVMERILAIQNPAVLHWFLAKGGTLILVTWLSEAATEQQTTVLLMILKVLVHLPLHKALPEYMSAILQSVNGLRFYRASDVSNRARMLLSRWSKLIARSQAVKKPNGVKSLAEAQNEMLLKQSISEVMGDESWQSNIENSEGILALPNVRKPESPQPLKLLPSPADDSSRKQTLGVSSSNNRVRRKVQLVEHPGQKMPSKSLQTTKLIQGRPMSADDIQKAKMRAMYMQSKYGKACSSSTGTNEIKIEGLKKPLIAQADVISYTGATKSLIAQADGASSLHMVCATPNTKERKELATPSPVIIDKLETPIVAKPKMDPIETSMEKCKQIRIQWQKPPEFELNYIWRVGAGEHSKEIDAQKNRHRREKETVYRSILEIPSNPKEPWDREIDYDDSLTPEIPIEQQPDVDSSETQGPETEHSEAVSVMSSSSQVGAGGTAGEPDLELLAVLLKNPELVFALTSGQAANISSEQTVKLLDMIKAGSVKDFGGKKEEEVQVSLPSPTPSSDPGTSGRRAEARNPFSHQTAIGNRVVSSTTLSTAVLPSPNFSMSHQQINGLSIAPRQLVAAMAQSVHGLENRQLAYISDVSSITPQSHTSISSLPVTLMQSHPQPIPQSNLVQIGSDKETWRGRQQLPSNHYGHVNVNAHNISFSRPVQPQSGPTPHLGRNRFVGGQGLRSWSPDDSLTMAQVYLPGQSGANLGSNHRSDRPWPGSSGLQDHNIQEKRGRYDRRG